MKQQTRDHLLPLFLTVILATFVIISPYLISAHILQLQGVKFIVGYTLALAMICLFLYALQLRVFGR